MTMSIEEIDKINEERAEKILILDSRIARLLKVFEENETKEIEQEIEELTREKNDTLLKIGRLEVEKDKIINEAIDQFLGGIVNEYNN